MVWGLVSTSLRIEEERHLRRAVSRHLPKVNVTDHLKMLVNDLPMMLVNGVDLKARPSALPSPRTVPITPTVSPPCRRPRGKKMVYLVNSHSNASSRRQHRREIDFRFAPTSPECRRG